MADIKGNVVSFVKAMAVFVKFGKKCFNCSKALAWREYQVDHITARAGVIYGNSDLHRIENLCPLCKKCNSEKGAMEAVNFYSKAKFAKLVKLANSYSAQPTKDKAVVSACVELAKSNESRKFSRTYQKGRYYKIDAVYMTDRTFEDLLEAREKAIDDDDESTYLKIENLISAMQ